MPRWLNLLKSVTSLIASPDDAKVTSINADQARSLLNSEPKVQIVDPHSTPLFATWGLFFLKSRRLMPRGKDFLCEAQGLDVRLLGEG
jgi:hypothetical protein